MRGKGLDRVLFLAIGVGFLIVCFVVMVFTLSDLYTEVKLDNEIETVQKELNKDKIDEEKLNKILKRRNATGSYSEIEDAYKENVINILEVIKEIKKFNEEVDLENTFTVENISNDGSEFTETKNKIQEYINAYELCNKDLEKIKRDESLWSYLPEKKSSKFDKKYLKDNILKTFKMKYIKNISNEFLLKKDTVNQAETMINFLIDNKENWKIKDDKLSFKTESLDSEYQKMNKKWEDLLSGKRPIIKIGE